MNLQLHIIGQDLDIILCKKIKYIVYIFYSTQKNYIYQLTEDKYLGLLIDKRLTYGASS